VGSEQAAEQRSAHGAKAGRDAVGGKSLDPFGCREHDLDHRQDLGDHQRAHGALGDPRPDEHPGALGGSAQRRHDRKAGHAYQEQALAAEGVAQAPAGDEHERVGQRVPGQRPLHVGVAGVQAALDGRDGDVDDRDVEQVHEGGQQHNDQGRPPPRVCRVRLGLAGPGAR
jgi:hypothetical protein